MTSFLHYKPLMLKDIAIRRLAANVLKESNILESISNFHCRLSCFDYYDERLAWRETIENELSDEISKFELPTSLAKLLTDTVKPMSRQVGRWKAFHEDYLNHYGGEEIQFEARILAKVCWTASGVVDYRRLAKKLIRSDVVGIVKKFRLGCLYCFEDYLPVFWRELPEENQKFFCSKIGSRLFSGGMYLQFGWPCSVEEDESEWDTSTFLSARYQLTDYPYAFHSSVMRGNKIAAEHFFQKLTHEEKGTSLMRTTMDLTENYRLIQASSANKKFPHEKFAELLIYLLSVMTYDQQMRIFQERTVEVLKFFLDWPWGVVFLEITDIVWDFLTNVGCHELLYWTYYNRKTSSDSCVKLYEEFRLRLSPDFWILSLDRQCASDSYFSLISHYQDAEAMEMVLKSVDAAARKRLVFSAAASYAFRSCFMNDKLDAVEVLLREAGLSRVEKKRLKEYILSETEDELYERKPKWSEFLDLLDGTDDDSRSCSEDKTPTDSEAERLN